VAEILKLSQVPVSLETPIGEEDSHLEDFIEDVSAPAPADVAISHLLKEEIQEVMKSLTEREAWVLQLRFGLEDGRSRTLKEVGREYGVTRERIRQIEAKALHKLRHPTHSRKLRDFSHRCSRRALCPQPRETVRRSRRARHPTLRPRTRLHFSQAPRRLPPLLWNRRSSLPKPRTGAS
jgi:hypothetical protein